VKQSLKQKQKLSLNITANLGNQIKLLSLSGFEISSKLNELIENYLLEDDKQIKYFKDEFLIDQYKNTLYSNDGIENRFNLDTNQTELKQKLFDQLAIESLNQIENLIGEFLIDSVEDNGRLDPELDYEDIKKIVLEDFHTHIEDHDIDAVLSIIQNFDPPGCAFRSIDESLSIQINNLDLEAKEKLELKERIQDLVSNKISLQNLPDHLKEVLLKLSLNLGGSFGQSSKNYIRPDLIAIRDKNLWHVSLNDDFMSRDLIEKIKDKVESSNKDDGSSISFLIGLERRQQTLFMVAKFLVETQENFLNNQAEKRALSNKQVANYLKISESTISRIVRNKYIQFPDKIIPLKDLLEKRLNKPERGKDVTLSDLKFLIEKLVSMEDKLNPLSDESLKFQLKNEFEILLSRRTIAKYRQELKIPPSRLRIKK
jgi:RNA polymerase sigma-54 factor